MFIKVEKDNKTTYRWVADDQDYQPERYESDFQGDLTTGTAKSVSLGISKERFNEIFGGSNGTQRHKV
jgi:hypothetical protein